jgi:hypothetical protein
MAQGVAKKKINQKTRFSSFYHQKDLDAREDVGSEQSS